MDRTKLYYIVGAILLLTISFGAGRYSKPAKVETKIQTKEVVKYVEAKQENKNVIVKTKKTTQTDGTIIEESQTEDKSVTKSDTKIDATKESKIETLVIRDSGLTIQALALAPLKNLDEREYGVLVKKRIIGNISGTVFATHKGTIGLAAGWDF